MRSGRDGETVPLQPDRERAVAYMLRLWCVTNGEARHWRASLQDVHTGERHGFAGLDEGMACMRQEWERLSREGRADLEEGQGAE
jgi:hypothetical protein